MTRHIHVVSSMLITLLFGTAAFAQQAPGILDIENAAAADVHYEISATTAKIPYANVSQDIKVKLSVIGSKPGASLITQDLEGMFDWGAITKFDKIYNENIGYPCKIKLSATSDDGWFPASVEVKHYYLNQLQSTAKFSEKGKGLGWIDNKGCGMPAMELKPFFNRALRGSATQSSTLSGGVAERAIDGNTSGEWYVDYSVSHTDRDAGSWWQVTLEKPAVIGMIVIWNRTDSFKERLRNFRVMVLDKGQNQKWKSVWHLDIPKDVGVIDTSPQGNYSKGFQLSLPEGIIGGRVRIEFPKDGSPELLHLAEVQVYGVDVSGQSVAKACRQPPFFYADTLTAACTPNSPLRKPTTAAAKKPTVSVKVTSIEVTPIERNPDQLVNFKVTGSVQNGNDQKAQISLKLFAKDNNGSYQPLTVNTAFVKSGKRAEQSRTKLVTSNSQNLNEQMAIPYGALKNLARRKAPYEVAAVASVQIGKVKLESERAEFQIVVN